MLSADRYIPSRNSFQMEESNYWLKRRKSKDILNKYLRVTPVYSQDVRFLHKINYIQQLSTILDINENRRVLPLCNAAVNRKYDTLRDEAQWPVYARTRPVEKPQFAVLDLPKIKNSLSWNVFNWGSNDFILAALNRNIYLWHVPTTTISQIIACANPVTCVKFDILGNQFALSTSKDTGKNLKIYDVKKCKAVSSCRPKICDHKCYVTAADWHISNKFFVTGCDKGNLNVLTHDLEIMSAFERGHDLEVITIKCSPDGTSVATSGADERIRVWSLPHLRLLFSHSDYYTKGLAWHPWRSSYLCFGSLGGTLGLINTSMGKILHQERDKRSVIYNVSFNKLTGELVTSHSCFERNQPVQCNPQVLVLARLNHAVDRFTGHSGRVLYLEWSPDHKVLATAGSDETIHMWRFIEEGQKSLKPKKIFTSNLHIFR